MLAQIHRESQGRHGGEGGKAGYQRIARQRWLSRGFDIAAAKATSAPKAKKPAKKAAAKKAGRQAKGQDA
jgi:hypothetical protein